MDNEQEAVPRDPTCVALEREEDVEYWTNRFSVSEHRLRAALAEAGRDVDAVVKALNG